MAKAKNTAEQDIAQQATVEETAPADIQDTETPVLPSADQGDGLVSVTITKFGDGQVSTGVHEAGFGDIFAKRGQTLRVAPKVAERLEALGFAEAD